MFQYRIEVPEYPYTPPCTYSHFIRQNSIMEQYQQIQKSMNLLLTTGLMEGL